MAGHPGENLIADAIGAEIIHGPNGAWQKITVNVEAIDEYRMAFDWIIGKEDALSIDETAGIAIFMARVPALHA